MPDRVMVTRAKLDSLAEAVGSKSGQGVPLTIEGMEDAVLGIETGIQPSGTLSISKNGTHDVTKYASAMVSVKPKLQDKTVHPTTEIQGVVADIGYDGLDEVVVEGMNLELVSVIPTKNGLTVMPSDGYDAIGSVYIEPPNLQSKNASPGKYTVVVVPDDEYVGLSSVYIEGIASVLQSKSATPVIGSKVTVGPDSEYSGLNVVTVEAVPYAFEDNLYGLTAVIG